VFTVEGGGWRVEGGGWRAEGGGRRVEGGGSRVEGGGRSSSRRVFLRNTISGISDPICNENYDTIALGNDRTFHVCSNFRWKIVFPRNTRPGERGGTCSWRRREAACPARRSAAPSPPTTARRTSVWGFGFKNLGFGFRVSGFESGQLHRLPQ
jgi:hypothetical protein